MTIKQLFEMLDGLPQTYEVAICTEEDEDGNRTEVSIDRYMYVENNKAILYLLKRE